MWLLVYVPAVLGVLRYRHRAYWRWVVAILFWQSAAQFLFSAQGTLEHPERSGLIMRAMQKATNDGPEIALFGVFFLAIFWGGMIYFVRRLYVAANAPDLGATAVKPVSGLRKGAELAVITALTAAMLYANVTALNAPAAAGASDAAASAIGVEADIDRIVTAVNATAPHKLDSATVLTSASREGRVLTYDYEVSDPGITAEIATAFLKDGITQKTCGDENNRRVLRGGGILRFRYALVAGGAPISRDFTPSDCATSGG